MRSARRWVERRAELARLPLFPVAGFSLFRQRLPSGCLDSELDFVDWEADSTTRPIAPGNSLSLHPPEIRWSRVFSCAAGGVRRRYRLLGLWIL